MKPTLAICVLLTALILNACTPRTAEGPTPQPTAEAATEAVAETALPEPPAPTPASQFADWTPYVNEAFGLKFAFPSLWFGPEAYVSDQTLRVEVGSDKVYPYGTDRTEQIYTLTNSYNIVIQYSRYDQNTYWQDTYQALSGLKDGESLSDARGLIIRLRQLTRGDFTGYEYISTLSQTAQTEPLYIRQIILVNPQSSVLTISGSPNNVDLSNGAPWREVYRSIDEANQSIFHALFETLTIK